MPRYYVSVENDETSIADPVAEDLSGDAAALDFARGMADELSRNHVIGEPWFVVLRSENDKEVARVQMVWRLRR